MKSIYVGSM